MMILSICENPHVLSVIRIIKIVIDLIKIIVPIALMISLMITFIGPITSNDKDALNKALKASVNKMIAALLVFLIPTFVSLIFSATGSDKKSFTACLNNATEQKIKEAYVEEARKYMNIANETQNRGDLIIANNKIQSLKEAEQKEIMLKEIKEIEKKVETKEKEYERQTSYGRASVSAYGFMWPIDESVYTTITTCFRSKDRLHQDLGSAHEAVDIAANGNSPVLASKDGVVTYPGPGDPTNCPQTSYIPQVNGKYSCASVGCTNYIVIKHDDGSETRYLHLMAGSIKVKKGDRVKQGEIIAGVGSSGCSTGNHLHFVVKVNNAPVDPLLAVGNHANACGSGCSCCR